MTTLRRIGRMWWADLYVGGKRVRQSLKTDNKFQAGHRLRALEDELRSKSGNGDVPFDEFAARYLEWARTAKPASVNEERQRLLRVQAWLEAAEIRYLGDVTPYVLEQFRAHLLSENISQARRKDGDIAPPPERFRSRSTVNRYMQLLRGMFYRAMDWDLYKGQNPVKKVRFFREERRLKPLTEEMTERVLGVCRDIGVEAQSPVQRKFYALVAFALNTGMRKAEVLHLKWGDVRDGEAVVKGKGGKTRAVPLNAVARQIVDAQPRRGPYVFDVENRDQPDLFRRTTAQVSKRVGFPFHFHLCRHRFATALIERGVDIVTVAAILGHSRTMTALLYAHSATERKRQAVELLETGIKTGIDVNTCGGSSHMDDTCQKD